MMKLGWAEVHNAIWRLNESIKEWYTVGGARIPNQIKAYGIPRGGSIVTGMLNCTYPNDYTLVDSPVEADILIDDIFDSGETAKKYTHRFGKVGFFLIDKRVERFKGQWVVFPWEETETISGPEEAVRRLLEYIEEDVKREGLLDTPARVLKAFREMTSGRDSQVEELLSKTFNEQSDEMVVVRDIRFTSICEHHLLPFIGKAHVAYVPTDKVVGLSKIPRLVECFAKRLQIQERMTKQIGMAMMHHLRPKGVGVVVDATHSCMSCRGVMKPEASMVTSFVDGVFKTDPMARSEFMSIIGFHRK